MENGLLLGEACSSDLSRLAQDRDRGASASPTTSSSGYPRRRWRIAPPLPRTPSKSSMTVTLPPPQNSAWRDDLTLTFRSSLTHGVKHTWRTSRAGLKSPPPRRTNSTQLLPKDQTRGPLQGVGSCGRGRTATGETIETERQT